MYSLTKRTTKASPVFLAGILAMGISARGSETKILHDFSSAAELLQWNAVNDSVMGGRSRGGPAILGSGTLTFSGILSLENRGGFSSVRSRGVSYEMDSAKGLVVRVRGDGRRYYLTVRTNYYIMAGSYRASFQTKANTWQEFSFPFDSFRATSFGRQLRNAPPINPATVRSVGFMLADKKAGSFRLEVDWIKTLAEKPVKPNLSTNADVRTSPRQLIETGIQRGVPLFNSGNPEACAVIYETVVQRLLTGPYTIVSSQVKEDLRRSLEEYRNENDSRKQAWILRLALDRAYIAMTVTAATR
jgi:monofunctional biosynthetic peptidoglycan transglycosylase